MKVLICGSRSIRDKETVLKAMHRAPFDCTLIIHGGARGVDSLADQIAKASDIPTKVFLPDWNKYGRSAGIIRNKEMVKEADAVIAVWDGKSRGTKSSIDFAQKMKKDVYILKVNE